MYLHDVLWVMHCRRALELWECMEYKEAGAALYAC